MTTCTDLPIGVFDSGVGGLTVLRALQEIMPHESFIYLGDTARVPYGIKSPETITRYALQTANILYQQGIKMLVVACNTASAFAVEKLQQTFNEIPVLSVIEPGALAACNTSKSGEIMVISTESTAKHKAYEKVIQRIRPEARVYSEGCSLFVSLAEEGWIEGPIAEAVVKEYLTPLFTNPQNQNIDCLVLGCTHFPVFQPIIKKMLHENVALVDSAKTTALQVSLLLANKQLQRRRQNILPQIRFLATDAPDRFVHSAQYFLGKTITIEQVELVDL